MSLQETKAAQLAKADAELKAAQETLRAAAASVKQVCSALWWTFGCQCLWWLRLHSPGPGPRACLSLAQAEAEISEFKASKDKAARLKDPWMPVVAGSRLVSTARLAAAGARLTANRVVAQRMRHRPLACARPRMQEKCNKLLNTRRDLTAVASRGIETHGPVFTLAKVQPEWWVSLASA